MGQTDAASDTPAAASPMNEHSGTVPSWWGKLPLPPVRPRYKILAVTGYKFGGPGRGDRKPLTTWSIHDRLHNARVVGRSRIYYSEAAARIEREHLEAGWDNHLREAGYTL